MNLIIGFPLGNSYSLLLAAGYKVRGTLLLFGVKIGIKGIEGNTVTLNGTLFRQFVWVCVWVCVWEHTIMFVAATFLLPFRFRFVLYMPADYVYSKFWEKQQHKMNKQKQQQQQVCLKKGVRFASCCFFAIFFCCCFFRWMNFFNESFARDYMRHFKCLGNKNLRP